jgi:hypothetical protein
MSALELNEKWKAPARAPRSRIEEQRLLVERPASQGLKTRR